MIQRNPYTVGPIRPHHLSTMTYANELLPGLNRTIVVDTQLSNDNYDYGEKIYGYKSLISRPHEDNLDLSTNRTAELWKLESSRPGRLRCVWDDGNSSELSGELMFGEFGTFAGPHTMPGFPQATIDACKSSLLNKILNTEKLVSGGTFVAEIKESLRAIRNIKKDLFESFRKITGGLLLRKKGSARLNPNDALDAISNLWLGQQFGWLPLYNDLLGFKQVLDRNVKEGYLRLRATKKTFEMAVDTHGPYTIYYTGHGDTNGVVTRADLTWHKCVCEAFVQLPTSSAQHQAGFDINQWAPTLWEVTPYSWLVDYFANVGDFVDNLTMKSEVKIYVQTLKSTSRQTRSLVPVDGVGRVFTQRDGGEVKYTGRLVKRTYGGGGLPIDLHWQIPSLGSLKWLNTAAFVQQNRQLIKHLFHS